MKVHLLLIIIILPFFLPACVLQPEVIDGSDETNALLETDRAWAAAAKAGDVDKVASFWAEDATNYFPGAPVARGKKAIVELVKKNRSKPGFSLSWEPREAIVAESGELGYTSGPFSLSVLGPEGVPIARTGHYVCIWKRHADGSWKCSLESTIFEANTR